MARKKIPKKNPTIEEDASNLPCEIIENILSRLPVKSLLRFKSVSKPWYSLISDAKFARFHLNQTKSSDSITLYPSPCLSLRPQTITFLRFTNQNFKLESLVFPLKKYRQATVLCSCDGLVLLKNDRDSDKMCVLWNPSTRTYTKFSCPNWSGRRSYGLCYDKSNDDYKVLVLIWSYSFYAVFSYKNNSWIEKKASSLVRNIRPYPGLYVNGALHWVTSELLKDFDSYAKEGRLLEQQHHKHCTECGYSHCADYPVFEWDYKFSYEICCFDPRDDEFKKLSKPACFDISTVFDLASLRGQLCLYRKTFDCTKIEIWTMTEYGNCSSWTKFVTIENLLVRNHCIYIRFNTFYCRPLCLTNENNIVLEILGSGLVVYNPNANKFDKICVYDEDNSECKRYMLLSPLLCWNDSLLLLSRINRTKRK